MVSRHIPSSFLALLAFHEQYQRAPALATEDVDLPNLMKILQEKNNSTTASASASNSVSNEELNEELLK